MPTCSITEIKSSKTTEGDVVYVLTVGGKDVDELRGKFGFKNLVRLPPAAKSSHAITVFGKSDDDHTLITKLRQAGCDISKLELSVSVKRNVTNPTGVSHVYYSKPVLTSSSRKKIKTAVGH